MKKLFLLIVFCAFASFGKTQDTSVMQKFVNEWLGLPYRFGGTTKRGIDCSAFVQKFYKQVFNLEIARTSYYQKIKSIPVTLAELIPGDILFFKSRLSPSGRHCGIYLGNDKFIHAANRKEGVKISYLSDSRYTDVYLGAGRFRN